MRWQEEACPAPGLWSVPRSNRLGEQRHSLSSNSPCGSVHDSLTFAPSSVGFLGGYRSLSIGAPGGHTRFPKGCAKSVDETTANGNYPTFALRDVGPRLYLVAVTWGRWRRCGTRAGTGKPDRIRCRTVAWPAQPSGVGAAASGRARIGNGGDAAGIIGPTRGASRLRDGGSCC